MIPCQAPVVFSTTARQVVLSDAETEKIMKTAAECAEGECSIDDVSGLIDELQAQQKEMEKRLEKIKSMVSELRHLNESGDERSDSEVRKFVRDLLRVFAHDDTKKIAKFTPSGFAGDVGSGSTTAYDALPPKKWKP